MARDHVAKRRAVKREGIQCISVRHEGAQNPVPGHFVQAEKGKGIAVASRYDGFDFPLVRLPAFLAHTHSHAPPMTSHFVLAGPTKLCSQP